ncbi:MAG: TetR/AcrR family transcriptional regulator [Hyphomicrobiaceae bacterium]|nr:TetR/AcrR family transcriptional regulator [Hyphomicrobiaceae bacterium]
MTSCQEPHEKGNGPASARTRGAILKTAAGLFLERGYGGTSVDLIAAEAGVARQTIYNQFASKEALFRAIFSALADEAMMPLAVAARKGASMRAALLRLARSHVAGALSPARLALYRLVVAEAVHFPELGRAIYGVGAARVVRQLADFLREGTRLGHLDVANPEAAAEQFLSMVTGFQQFRGLMGLPAPSAEVDTRTEEAVDTFLRAFKGRPQRGMPRARR